MSDIVDREVAAITQCVRALSGLDLEQQVNILSYLISRNAHGQRVMKSLVAQMKREAGQ